MSDPEAASASAGAAPATGPATGPVTGPAGKSDAWLGIAIVLGGIFTQVLVTANSVLASRMLGVEGRGQVVLVMALAAMASQLTLGGGVPNAVTRLLADRGVTARDGLRPLLRPWFLASLVPAACVGAYLLHLEWDAPAGTKWGLAVAVAVMAVQAMATRILIGAMVGEGTPPVAFLITSLGPQLAITLTIGVAFLLDAHLSALEMCALIIVSSLVFTVVRIPALRKPTGRPEDALDGREVWRLTRKTHVGSVGPIDGLQVDRTLVGSLLGNTALGLYSAATAVTSLTLILGNAIAMVLLPRLTVAQSDAAGERVLVRRWLLIAAAIIGACVVGLEVIAGPAIRIAFGDEFAGSIPVAHWLIAASGLLTFRRVLIAVLQARGRGEWASWIEVALTPVVVLGIWLASRDDSLDRVGHTMLAVGVVACAALAVAAHRARPGGPGAAPTEPETAGTGDVRP